MSALVGTAAPQALRDEVEATLTQVTLGGRQALVIALAFDGDDGMSFGALSPDLSADQLATAANRLEMFAAEVWARAKAVKS